MITGQHGQFHPQLPPQHPQSMQQHLTVHPTRTPHHHTPPPRLYQSGVQTSLPKRIHKLHAGTLLPKTSPRHAKSHPAPPMRLPTTAKRVNRQNNGGTFPGGGGQFVYQLTARK